MSGELLAPTPLSKPPLSSRLPLSTKRQFSAKPAIENDPPQKRPKLQATGKPGKLRRSMSSDNINFSARVAASRPKTQQKQTLVTAQSNRQIALRKAESTVNVSTRRQPIIQKAGSNANIVDVNSNEGYFVQPAAKKVKRPAWDLKGRLQDQEQENEVRQREYEEMKCMLNDALPRIKQLETVKITLEATVQETETKSVVATSEVESLKRQLRERDEVILEKDRKLYQRDRLVAERDGQLAERDAQNAMLLEELARSRDANSSLKGGMACVQSQLSSVNIQYEACQSTVVEKQAIIDDLMMTVQNKDSQLLSSEQLRRKMHNQIQELKGNIRVFVRVRPFIRGEVLEGPLDLIPHIRKPDAALQTIELMKPAVQCNKSVSSKSVPEAKSSFSFDAVMMPNVSQNEVFSEVSQLVQSALDGYNVCIFAYGQTGAGKTYTMEGCGQGDQMGIIPRSISQIFKSMEALAPAGWKYALKGMFVEIYNETLQDLLCKKDLKLEIKNVEGKKDEIFVTNLTYVDITTEEQIFKFLKVSQKNRAVAATHCNERSSRSHFVFQLQLMGTNSQTGEINAGTLNLVDLAGSERLKESLSEGDRLTETKNINKSLSNLGNVIMALAQRNPHIPYRNSKLTHLLSNSLGGNSKTLMLVNISPKEEHYSESINSLRFATKVNQCHIGTAVKKTKSATAAN